MADSFRKEASRKLRVLLVSQPTTGGVAVHVSMLASHLVTRGHTVYAACPVGPLQTSLRKSGATVRTLQFIRGAAPVSDAVAVAEIVSLIQGTKPDIVHAHSSKAGLVGRLGAAIAGHRGVVFTPHGFSVLSVGEAIRPLVAACEKLLARKTALLLASSRSDVRLAKSLGYRDTQIGLVYPPVVDENWNNARLFEDRRKEYDIISITRNDTVKNAAMVLDVLGVLKCLAPGMRAALVLSDPTVASVNSLRQEARRRNLSGSITFFHNVERVCALQLLSQSRCLLLTSLHECLPFAILEAMALRVPVVATDVVGTRDLVQQSKTGFLVPANDVNGMAKIVLSLLRNRSLAKSVSESAHAFFVKNFDSKKSLDCVDSLYRGITDFGAVQSKALVREPLLLAR